MKVREFLGKIGDWLAVVEEWIPVAKGQVGKIAGEHDAVIEGVLHRHDSEIVKTSIVGAGALPAQQRYDCD